ncbi:hypothetical protein COL26b_012558 [Colletotrichum chrysophilum]|uniref:uncharacterized protein n=1 Tax=Colletotrichum chrysophilum TaxID=1836956 RepID=UPI0023011CC4|nr:uncharacterized protein COL26b_012558 [Colletotrichum chrysophilum]KAJ0364276.1 hypothetical protein COL26b_012558 [Colletotrichum chrysophilum]
MENSHKNGTLTDILEPKEAVDAVAKYAPPQDHSNGRRGAHNEGLCEDCAVLDLGVHCFKVQPGSTKPAGKPVQDQPAAIRSYTTPHHLGSLSDIRNRSSECEMCALIIDSVEEAGTQNPTGDVLDAAAEHALENAKCSISWEIDGREASRSKSRGHNPANTVRGITRRVHIRWDHPRLSDAYLVYVAPERFARTASDADRVWAKDSLFLGRKITEDIENQALIRSWLDLCQKSHRGPCRQNKDEGVERFVEMVSHSYFGVIDVQNMQLTQLPCKSRERSRDGRERRYAWGTDMHEPYVALSYVWGTDETAYTTLTDNVMLHRMHGGLEDVLLRLPKAIQDAIDLVRRLGFKYMWIDRLCIVQNSSRSWKLNAFNMDLIYGNAALTICAADGDASIGLRAMRPSTRNTKQYKRMINPHLELMVTRPPEIYIRSSEWNERAWTFQERLLSRRCLIFTNGRVYFQCRSTGMSEDIFGDQKGAGWSLDLVDAPMQMFRQLDDRAFWVYMKCVELYTERKLTQAKDIQAAFSGMANMMEERMNAPFIHGLPSSHFDLALLWEPVSDQRRKVTREGALFGAGPVVSEGLVSAPAPVHTADFFDMFFEDNEKEFSITLRDYPYRVVKAPFEPKPETSEFPLLPILQFRTWHTWLYIKHNGPSERQFHDRKLLSMGTESGLARYHIADEMGDWCGSVVLEAEWAAKASDKQEFIAISEAKSFTRDECPEWTYYIPKEREQSEWDLFYVLLIERKDEKWERVGVGKVFKEAFHNSKQKEIMLS